MDPANSNWFFEFYVNIFIKYGAVSNKRKSWRQHLDFIRFRRNMDGTNRTWFKTLAFNIIILHGTISNCSCSVPRQYLDLFRLWTYVDDPNRTRKFCLVFSIFIINGTVSKYGCSKHKYKRIHIHIIRFWWTLEF